MTQTEALELALEALLDLKDDCSGCEFEWSNDYPLQAKALQAIDKVLAQQCVCGEPNSSGTHRTDGPCLAPQPEQEPATKEQIREAIIFNLPLYTASPQRTWVGLTDEDIGQWIEEEHDVLRWAEAKLKEKNT